MYLCTRIRQKKVGAKQNVRDLAQLVAHTSGGREVAGSSPVIPTERRENRKIPSLFCLCFAAKVIRFCRNYSRIPLPDGREIPKDFYLPSLAFANRGMAKVTGTLQ